MKSLTRTIWILSLVSLFTDMASEMLYPVMPIYLRQIGFTVLLIGILEGVAEASASLSKGFFGSLSDASGARAPFVRAGYTLSAAAKPLLVLIASVPWVLFLRTADRLGKGIRTGARDAILADESRDGNRGKIFGFHRSMDTIGAALGPAIALLYLYLNPAAYKPLFVFAFAPGAVAVALTFLVHDRNKAPLKKSVRKPLFSGLRYWKESSPDYRKLLSGLLFFALFNSSDMFLILKLKETGIGDTAMIAIYIFYNTVYSLAAFPLGMLADRVGLKKMFLSGLVLFSIVYAGMAFPQTLPVYILLFFLYGLYYGCTEGVAKAWVSSLCNKKDTATAIGVYAGLQGISALAASTITGLVWYKFGALPAFAASSIAALAVFLFLLMNKSLPQAV